MDVVEDEPGLAAPSSRFLASGRLTVPASAGDGGVDDGPLPLPRVGVPVGACSADCNCSTCLSNNFGWVGGVF